MSIIQTDLLNYFVKSLNHDSIVLSRMSMFLKNVTKILKDINDTEIAWIHELFMFYTFKCQMKHQQSSRDVSDDDDNALAGVCH